MDTATPDRFAGFAADEIDQIGQLAQLARTHGAESRAADIVAARVLVGRFRYTLSLGWLEYDGMRWDADDIAEPRVIEEVRQFIDQTERDYRADAEAGATAAAEILKTAKSRFTDEEKAELDKVDGKAATALLSKLVAKHTSDEEKAAYTEADARAAEAKRQADMWHNFLSAGKIASITKLCRGMDEIVTRSTAFDSHPDLLNCTNGVVDLTTGELRPHNPDLLLTHLAGGDYDPKAKSSLWTKALAAVQPEVLEWFQTRMGQSITGHTPDDDALVVCAGGGENGKSAVMSGIMRAVGTYGRLISHRVLIAQPGQHPTELMDLRGLRFALLEETPEEGRLDTHQLKTTIGTPYITARHMRMNDVTFATSHTLWVNTNFLPQVDTTDNGTWRRLRAMPWPFKFLKPGQTPTADYERAGDLTLKPALAQNPTVPAAVLAWLVEGAVRWYQNERVSEANPKVVEDYTTEWRATTDVGLQYSTEYLAQGTTADFIPADVLFEEFNAFLQAQGKHRWTKQTMNIRFPASLEAAGIAADSTPRDNTRVSATMKQSRPATKRVVDPEEEESWRMASPVRPAVDIVAGKVVKCWRGVRFRTEAEIGQPMRRAG